MNQSYLVKLVGKVRHDFDSNSSHSSSLCHFNDKVWARSPILFMRNSRVDWSADGRWNNLMLPIGHYISAIDQKQKLLQNT